MANTTGRKFGGRVKGTPNKYNSDIKTAVAGLIQTYASAQKDGASLMTQDFLALEPKDRIMIAEKLMQYTVPKMQAVAVDSSNEHRVTIEEKIAQLAKVPGIDE